MKYLAQVALHAAERPNKMAVSTSDGRDFTYGELENASNRIGSYIRRTLDELNLAHSTPVVVCGHKDPLMIACFLGCLKSGHPYIPIDVHSVPKERLANIMEQVGRTIVFEVEPHPAKLSESVGEKDIEDGLRSSIFVERAQLEDISKHEANTIEPDFWVEGEDLAYIIFTSGSTGTPKGVEITADCFDNFCDWASTIGIEEAPRPDAVFLNQAPFSFDLSVYELAQSLSAGATLFCLTKEVQDSASKLMDALSRSDATIWVSTPSFVELCMSNSEFSSILLPRCKLFLFCGEALRNSTALHLQDRFPNAFIYNTYGPTESTVAVTSIRITKELASREAPLPCGNPKPGTRIIIASSVDSDSFAIAEVETGQLGEIVIAGNTVAKGYFKRDDLTKGAFGKAVVDGSACRAYRTGDEGFLDDEGNLHYRGRLDLQIKLNGYRIELGEIEENLARLPQVKEAAVVMVRKSEGVSYLEAHIVSTSSRKESDFREGLKLKQALKQCLPHYMIPKKIIFHDFLPRTPNGKIDRKALA